MAIVNYANMANAIASPLTNLADVYFHTDLPYLQLKEEVSGSVSFPLVARKYHYYDDGSSDC